jgi:hypothetical protein
LLGTNMNRALDAVIGGWSASSSITLQTGHRSISRCLSRACPAAGNGPI